MARYRISTDGYRAEEGARVAVGWAFVAERDGERFVGSGALPDVASHVAEWVAVSEALAWAEERLVEGDTLLVRTDSALVAKGLASRRPEMSGEAAERRAACRQALARLAQRGIKAKVERVGRSENADADAAARQAAGG